MTNYIKAVIIVHFEVLHHLRLDIFQLNLYISIRMSTRIRIFPSFYIYLLRFTCTRICEYTHAIKLHSLLRVYLVCSGILMNMEWNRNHHCFLVLHHKILSLVLIVEMHLLLLLFINKHGANPIDSGLFNWHHMKLYIQCFP